MSEEESQNPVVNHLTNCLFGSSECASSLISSCGCKMTGDNFVDRL